jgi:hypothetical protein
MESQVGDPVGLGTKPSVPLIPSQIWSVCCGARGYAIQCVHIARTRPKQRQ